ncbi:MAG TPA: hypothetical protein VEB40_08210, partial [Flavipsychrobacter sp.]|nr:hypothetical protein [Flavipsychrobacter sp.]
MPLQAHCIVVCLFPLPAYYMCLIKYYLLNTHAKISDMKQNSCIYRIDTCKYMPSHSFCLILAVFKNIRVMKEVYIISAVRTPLGSWGGSLKDFSATQLGAFAIKAAIERAGVS